jgi:hypothetical protein
VTTGYEGDRSYRTDSVKHKHPFQEAPEAKRRLMAHLAPVYDEFPFPGRERESRL